MAKQQTIAWHKVDTTVSGLETGVEHELIVQREAIPLVFIPGIMGTRLRLTGTNGEGRNNDGLPNMRWDPSSGWWMFRNYSGAEAGFRKRMLVGSTFRADFLEPANDDPVGNGFSAIMEDYYKKFLNPLRELKERAALLEPLTEIFDFPVYAIGCNWTDDLANTGKKVAARIKAIIAEAKKAFGLCEKVILMTHSQGGMSARWAREFEGADPDILGIIHCVQPVNGSPAAYWRIKAGFEGGGLTDRITSNILGSDGTRVTPLLANIPGGLELLPSKLYKTSDDRQDWLRITQAGQPDFTLPKVDRYHPTCDPYEQIYRVKAVVQPTNGEKPSTNAYWGLVDPNMLNPGTPTTSQSQKTNPLDQAQERSSDPWPNFLALLKVAETFHDQLGIKKCEPTFCLRGVGHPTAEWVEMRVKEGTGTDSYQLRGFRGFFTDAGGKSMQAVLQSPAGNGDATVPRSSARALDDTSRPDPGDRACEVEHQPAYEDSEVQNWVIQAILALCKMRFEQKRGG